MLLPQKFSLAAIPIDIIQEEGLVKNKGIIGEARYSTQQIAIDPTAAPKETVEQSIWHEVLHWCFYILGEDKLRKNEKLIDSLAHLVYQYEQTRQYK